MKEEKGVWMKCKRCQYAWNFEGDSIWYASCPRCKTTIPIPKIQGEKLAGETNRDSSSHSKNNRGGK